MNSFVEKVTLEIDVINSFTGEPFIVKGSNAFLAK